MTAPDRGEYLANQYATWVKEVDRHWPAEGGGCTCGAAESPCGPQVIAQQKVTAVEAEWRAEGQRLVAQQAAALADRSGAPGGAAQHAHRPAPSHPRRWT